MTDTTSAALERPSTPAHLPAPGTSQGSLRRACVVAAVLAWALFAVLLVHDGGLLHRDTFGNFYDAQADALLHGRWNVDPKEMSLEGFVVHGKTYTYFGPVPAVMRLPVETVTHRFHGRLTRLSMLAAEAVLLAFVLRLVGLVWRLARPVGATGRRDALLGALFVFAAGASSSLYLAGKAWVYHEALLWGAAFSVGSLTLLGEFLTRRRLAHAAWAGVFGALALLTRASVGAGPIVALGLAAVWEAWQAWRERGERGARGEGGEPEEREDATPAGLSERARWSSPVVLGAGAVAPAILYVGVNLARFGTAFGLPVAKQVVAKFDPQTKAALAANHNSLFGVQFLPTQLLQSLRPDALEAVRLVPFLDYPSHHAHVVGGAVFQAVDPASSLTASEPLLFLLALVGIVALVRPSALGLRAEARAWRIPVLGAAAGAAGYLFVYFVANRYYTDALPLLVVAGAIGAAVLAGVLGRVDAGGRARVVPGLAAAVMTLLALFGLWANSALALEDRYVVTDGTEAPARARWVSWQLSVDHALHGSAPLGSIRRVTSLGPPGPRDRFAVLGACTGLFVSNGQTWRIVDGDASIEANVAGQVTAAAPGGAVTLAERRGEGGVSSLVWRTLADGRHRVDLEYTGDDGAMVTVSGDTVLGASEAPGAMHVILDANTHQAELRSGDRVLLNTYVPLSPGGRIEPGAGLRASYSSMDVCRRADAKARTEP